MKKFYYGVLSIIAMLILAVITFNTINNYAHWVDLTQYAEIILYITIYGPIITMSMFALGGLFGKILSKIFFVVIILMLIVLAISIFAPNWLTKIFNGANISLLDFFIKSL